MAQDPVLAEAVAAAVLAHPGVARLSGGPFGTIASYLPGRRVIGVRLPLEDTDPVEIAVVAVDVTVTDVETAEVARSGLA